MNIAIKATNMELTPAIEDYVRKRFEGLKKFIKGDDDEVKPMVEVGKTSRHHKKGDFFRAEISLRAGGKSLYAASEKADLYAAIDDVKEEIERELLSQKTKRIDTARRMGAKIKNSIKNIQ